MNLMLISDILVLLCLFFVLFCLIQNQKYTNRLLKLLAFMREDLTAMQMELNNQRVVPEIMDLHREKIAKLERAILPKEVQTPPKDKINGH